MQFGWCWLFVIDWLLYSEKTAACNIDCKDFGLKWCFMIHKDSLHVFEQQYSCYQISYFSTVMYFHFHKITIQSQFPISELAIYMICYVISITDYDYMCATWKNNNTSITWASHIKRWNETSVVLEHSHEKISHHFYTWRYLKTKHFSGVFNFVCVSCVSRVFHVCFKCFIFCFMYALSVFQVCFICAMC